MRKAKYVMHVDPGHAWLAVKKSELIRLGIADKISSCSYQKNDIAYLEEDCDASLFFKAKKALGEDIAYEESYVDITPIRNYDSYSSERFS